jgi:hypothetical protein
MRGFRHKRTSRPSFGGLSEILRIGGVANKLFAARPPSAVLSRHWQSVPMSEQPEVSLPTSTQRLLHALL